VGGRRLRGQTVPTLVFVGPAGDASKNLLETAIVPAAKEAGFNVITAGDDSIDDIDIQRTIDLLGSADLLLADVTDTHPNVLFALGARYQTSRPIVLLAPEGTEVPFDLVTRRIVFFNRSATGLVRLRKDLLSTLSAIEGDVVAVSEAKGLAPGAAKTGAAAGAAAGAAIGTAFFPGLGTVLGAAAGAVASARASRARSGVASARNDRELESLLHRVETDSSREVAARLNDLGLALLEQGDMDEAEVVLRLALRVAESQLDKTATGSLLSNLASVYGRRGDHAQATRFYELARSRLVAEGNASEAAKVLQNLAAESASAGDVSRAVDLLEESQEVFRDVGDRRSEAIGLRNIAILSANQGDFNTAEKRMSAAFEIATAIDDNSLLVSVSGAFASILAHEGHYERALDLLERSLEQAAEEDVGSRAALLRQLGDIAFRIGDEDEAVDVLTEAVRLDRISGDRRSLGTSLSLLGLSLKAANRSNEARLVLQEAIEVVARVAPADEIRRLVEELACLDPTGVS
jgi:tetratricopeptide (TPR) repeat protein